MDYREFVEELTTEIETETGLRTEFHKTDERMSRDSIWVYIGQDEDNFHILQLFVKESYCEWKQRKITFYTIVKGVKQSMERYKNMGVSDKMRQLRDYDRVKDKLFIRLINFKKNKEELEYSLYKQNGDIALTLYMKIAEGDGEFTSCKVPLGYVERWNLDKEDVFREALKNTASIMPPKVYELLKMITKPDYDGEDIYDTDYVPMRDEMGNCLSTSEKTNGAVAIFYPGVAKLLCQKMDTQDLYLSFTSVHEVMVHNAEKIEPEDLKAVLEDTIKESTPKCDVLTKHVYHYNINSDQIEMLE